MCYILDRYGYFQNILVHYSISKNKQSLVSVFQALCYTTGKKLLKPNLKCTKRYWQVSVLPSRCLVRPAADDDFVICRNARVDNCLCCHVDV